MLLRDERQMALSAVETLCFETADSYANAAKRTDDQALATRFETLAAQRRGLAADLAAHIRALDDLPQQPDPDREAFQNVVSSVMALLSGDVRTTLIDERIQGEEALTKAVREALQHALPPDTQSMLQRLLAHAESARNALEAARRPAGEKKED